MFRVEGFNGLGFNGLGFRVQAQISRFKPTSLPNPCRTLIRQRRFRALGFGFGV